MEIILTEKIKKLGHLGDIVSVRSGYARNFLIPYGKAIRATKENLKKFEEERSQREAHNLETKKEAEKVASKINNLSIIIIRSASESGQLYGSVNTRDIMKSIIDSGFTITHKQVILENTLKELGLFKVKIELHPEVLVEINLNIARSSEEAKTQEKTGEAVVEKIEVSENYDILKEDKKEIVNDVKV